MLHGTVYSMKVYSVFGNHVTCVAEFGSFFTINKMCETALFYLIVCSMKKFLLIIFDVVVIVKSCYII